MKFMGKYEIVPVGKDLNSLGAPNKHRCMRCGTKHRILWESIRFLDGVVSIGKTRCRCGDEVVSIWGEPWSLMRQFAELYRRENSI